PPGGPARYNPIHEDDFIATLPKLLDVASVPATTVNWCGEQTVSLQEWCGYLGSLVGREPVFEESALALRGGPTDVTRMRELVGGTTVDWRDGMRRMAAKFHPDLVGVRTSSANRGAPRAPSPSRLPSRPPPRDSRSVRRSSRRSCGVRHQGIPAARHPARGSGAPRRR